MTLSNTKEIAFIATSIAIGVMAVSFFTVINLLAEMDEAYEEITKSLEEVRVLKLV